MTAHRHGDAAPAGPGALRAQLARREPLLATFGLIPSPEVVELIALAGFDAVVLDMEHGPFDHATLRVCLVAARSRGLPALVRVRSDDAALIGAALDAGADGVLVPQVSSVAAARRVVSAARFAPQGARGANPWVRAADYSGAGEWFAQANRDVAVVVMIEGVGGLAAIDDILALDGLDAVFLGPVDLSHSLGLPGQPEHPRVLEALEDVARRAAARGVATAVFAPEAERARSWFARGASLVACGVDAGLVRSGLARVVAAARQPVR